MLYTHFIYEIINIYSFQTEGHGDPDEVHLDDEMEKVFAGTEKFSTQFTDDGEADCKYCEQNSVDKHYDTVSFGSLKGENGVEEIKNSVRPRSDGF